MFDWIAMLMFAGYVAFGATVRTMLGIYKAYDTFPELHIEWKRIIFEIVMSILFGTFGVFVLSELNIFNFGLTIAAVVAGLLGPDTIKLITKKFGLTKATEAIVSKQQMKNADLNEKEVRAVGYVKKFGKINNKIYQKINFTNHDTAKRDLNSLVKKGKLQVAGYNRSCHYVIPRKNQQGYLGASRGMPKTYTRKMTLKTPGQKITVLKPILETQKRDVQNN